MSDDPTDGFLSAAVSAVKLFGAVAQATPRVIGAAGHLRNAMGRTTTNDRSIAGGDDEHLVTSLDLEDAETKRAYEKVNMVLRTLGQRIGDAGLVSTPALVKALTGATSHIEVQLFSAEGNRIFQSLAPKLNDPITVFNVFTSVYFLGAVNAELANSLPNYKDTYPPLAPSVCEQLFVAAIGLDAVRENRDANVAALRTLATTAGLLRPTDIGYAIFPGLPTLSPSRYSSKAFNDVRNNKKVLGDLCKHFEAHGFPQPLPGRHVGPIKNWQFLRGDANSRVFEVEKADKHIGESFGRVLYWLLCSADRIEPGVAVIAYYEQHVQLVQWMGARFGYQVLQAATDLDYRGPHAKLNKKLRAYLNTFVLIMRSDVAQANRKASAEQWARLQAQHIAPARASQPPLSTPPLAPSQAPAQAHVQAQAQAQAQVQAYVQAQAQDAALQHADFSDSTGRPPSIRSMSSVSTALASASDGRPAANVYSGAASSPTFASATLPESSAEDEIHGEAHPRISPFSHVMAIAQHLPATNAPIASPSYFPPQSSTSPPLAQTGPPPQPHVTIPGPVAAAEMSAVSGPLSPLSSTSHLSMHSTSTAATRISDPPPSVAGSRKSVFGRVAPKPPRRVPLARALYDFMPEEEVGDELTFSEGDILEIMEESASMDEEGWCKARLRGTNRIAGAPLEFLEKTGEMVLVSSVPARKSLPRDAPRATEMYAPSRSASGTSELPNMSLPTEGGPLGYQASPPTPAPASHGDHSYHAPTVTDPSQEAVEDLTPESFNDHQAPSLPSDSGPVLVDADAPASVSMNSATHEPFNGAKDPLTSNGLPNGLQKGPGSQRHDHRASPPAPHHHSHAATTIGHAPGSVSHGSHAHHRPPHASAAHHSSTKAHTHHAAEVEHHPPKPVSGGPSHTSPLERAHSLSFATPVPSSGDQAVSEPSSNHDHSGNTGHSTAAYTASHASAQPPYAGASTSTQPPQSGSSNLATAAAQAAVTNHPTPPAAPYADAAASGTTDPDRSAMPTKGHISSGNAAKPIRKPSSTAQHSNAAQRPLLHHPNSAPATSTPAAPTAGLADGLDQTQTTSTLTSAMAGLGAMLRSASSRRPPAGSGMQSGIAGGVSRLNHQLQQQQNLLQQQQNSQQQQNLQQQQGFQQQSQAFPTGQLNASGQMNSFPNQDPSNAGLYGQGIGTSPFSNYGTNQTLNSTGLSNTNQPFASPFAGLSSYAPPSATTSDPSSTPFGFLSPTSTASDPSLSQFGFLSAFDPNSSTDYSLDPSLSTPNSPLSADANPFAGLASSSGNALSASDPNDGAAGGFDFGLAGGGGTSNETALNAGLGDQSGFDQTALGSIGNGSLGLDLSNNMAADPSTDLGDSSAGLGDLNGGLGDLSSGLADTNSNLGDTSAFDTSADIDDDIDDGGFDASSLADSSADLGGGGGSSGWGLGSLLGFGGDSGGFDDD